MLRLVGASLGNVARGSRAAERLESGQPLIAAVQFKPFGSVHGSFELMNSKICRCLCYSKILWRSIQSVALRRQVLPGRLAALAAARQCAHVRRVPLKVKHAD
jgi:hypothetical protein